MALELRKIGPQEAERILEGNTNNRVPNKRAIVRYAEMMTRGDWTASNDSVCISPEGVLMNGQHRLNAVVLSNTVQEFWVWEDCPPEALMAMDMGRKREAADVATLAGTKVLKSQAKALRLIKTPWNQKSTITASPQELMEWVADWDTYLELAFKHLEGPCKKHALLLASSAEAWRWVGGDTEKGIQAADFLSIMMNNQPFTDRPVDSKGDDAIACFYHRWVNGLAKSNKRLSSFAQYKLVLNGLQAHLLGRKWSMSRHNTPVDAPQCESIFDRF